MCEIKFHSPFKLPAKKKKITRGTHVDTRRDAPHVPGGGPLIGTDGVLTRGTAKALIEEH